MAIDMLETVREACKVYSGSGQRSLAEGKSLKLETSPRGEELLDMTVPAGKRWELSFNIVIAETDA